MKIVKGTYSALFLYALFFATWMIPEQVYLQIGVVIRPMDITAILLVLAGVAHRLSRGNAGVPRDRSLMIFGVLMLWGAASFVWAQHKGPVLSELIQWLEFVLIFIILLSLLKTEDHLRQFILTLLVLATLNQFLLGLDSLPVFLGMKSYVRERPDPFFSVVLLTFLCAFLAEKELVFNKPTMIVLMILSAGNLLFSLNRKDIIGFVLCLGLLLALSARKKRLFLRRAFLGVCVAAVLVLAVRISSPQVWNQLSARFGALTFQTDPGGGLEGRITHIAISYNIFKHHPVVGLGLGNHHRQFKDYFVQVFPGKTRENIAGLHNGFLLILGELGLVGLGVFLVLLWRPVRLIVKYKDLHRGVKYPGILLGSISLLPVALLKFGTAHAGIGRIFPVIFLLVMVGAYERILAHQPKVNLGKEAV